MVVADNEINEFEVEVLERYLPVEQNEEIHAQKQLIFYICLCQNEYT